MSLETGQAAIDATIRSALRHGYRSVKLKYAGGEPLLCLETVALLHHYAKSEAEKHDLTLTGVVLSNGTRLTTDTVKQMQALGLKLMISLDDLGDTSKPQRLYPDGRSAALDAMRAVELALAHDLVPDISITVSGRNAGDLPALMRWVLARDLPFNLNFYRENDRSAQKTDLQLEEQRIISGMRAVYRIIEANLPRHTLLAALVDRANLATPHQHTCSAGHSYLVFNARGEVSKCQMVLDEAITDLNSPDPLLDIQLDQTSIINPPVDTKTGCQSCEWRYWCGGGCPLQAHRTSGTYNAPSPNCNIYRTLYPEVVRLEGLRLLRYGS